MPGAPRGNDSSTSGDVAEQAYQFHMAPFLAEELFQPQKRPKILLNSTLENSNGSTWKNFTQKTITTLNHQIDTFLSQLSHTWTPAKPSDDVGFRNVQQRSRNHSIQNVVSELQ